LGDPGHRGQPKHQARETGLPLASLGLLKYIPAASSCQFEMLLPFTFLPFTYFSCLPPLPHPKLPHELPVAESADAAPCLSFSVRPATPAHTHGQQPSPYCKQTRSSATQGGPAAESLRR